MHAHEKHKNSQVMGALSESGVEAFRAIGVNRRSPSLAVCSASNLGSADGWEGTICANLIRAEGINIMFEPTL